MTRWVVLLATVALGMALAWVASAHTVVTPPGERVHRIEIVGLDCLNLVVVDGRVVVCVRPLAATRGALLRIPDDVEFIEEVYLLLFWRVSDPPGRAYWLGRLSGGLPRAAVIDAFVASPEYRNRSE